MSTATELPVDLAPILALSADDRVLIAHAILDSVTADADEEAELPEAFKAELRRRVADHQANPSSAIPWEVVKAQILSRGKQ